MGLPWVAVRFIAEIVRDKLDEHSLRIFKAYLRGSENPFEVLDRRTDPVIAVEMGHFDVVKWL